MLASLGTRPRLPHGLRIRLAGMLPTCYHTAPSASSSTRARQGAGGTRSSRTGLALATLLVLFSAWPAAAQVRRVPLDQTSALTPLQTQLEVTDYRGKRALKVTHAANITQGSPAGLVVVKDLPFRDGTIELELASTLAKNANPAARGFIGLAFRTAADGSRFEFIYLRPTNGRADDQVRRNHSTQYASHPDYNFDRLRKESPEKYESYVDLELGAWTKVKIVVSGASAKLYVHGAEQPCLIVNDLKLGADVEGALALQIGPGTEGYFADLRVTPAGAAASSPTKP
jgi:hypothetical protein